MKTGGPSEHSDRVSTHKLSSKKVYTERLDCTSGVTEGVHWVRLHRPWEKNLPFSKKYKNQSKLHVDMNDTLVLALFSKTLL